MMSSLRSEEQSTGGPERGPTPDKAGARFVFDVDGVTYEHNRPKITGEEIMALADISLEEGLIQVLPDGSRQTVAPNAEVHLVPGAQFKRRPRFKRG